MRNQIFCFLICLLLFASCNQTSKKESNQELSVIISDSISSNQKWMQAINNKNLELLSSLYTENAMVLSANGVDLENRSEILELVPKVDFVVKSVSTTKRIQANDSYDYEIGSFVNKDDGLAKHLIIWNTSNNEDKRELEFIIETDQSKVNLMEIDKQRANWIAFCNAHDAKSLIENVYSENTMYYNRGRLLIGRDDLVKEYEYMNNEQYQLTLSPILVEPVSETIVYEFGQCKGSYSGKYILVWQKNSEGIWQVLFDSNI
jgi:ketosteroid isomerase-like protein